MNLARREFLAGAATATAAAAALLPGCGCQANNEQDQAQEGDAKQQATAALSLDMSAWKHDSADDVYYQLGVSYCERPADASRETLAILVPGAYFTAQDNGDGTFTCEVNETGTAGAYTAATAPVVMPINTPGYSAQNPLSSYASQRSYTGEGIVYVHAGCRGRDAGAPAGVTDLKAAVRFLRLNDAILPGNSDRIFVFGMSGGGAQSAIVGATGDSGLYDPYLTAIGAASGVSDAVCGSMDWCPITGLDVADAAYEWMMGSTRSGLSDEEQGISDGLAESFAAWVNHAGLVDENGAKLELVVSDEGTYQAGSYYEVVRSAIEESLSNYLADAQFPLTVSSAGGMGGPRRRRSDDEEVERQPEETEPTEPEGNPGENMPDDMGEGVPGDEGNRRAGGPVDIAGARIAGIRLPGTGEEDAAEPGEGGDVEAGGAPYEGMDDISRSVNEGGLDMSGTYQTAADYVAALNADAEWASYDEATGLASVTSVAAFCDALKRASKGIGAFDQLDRGQGENTLFGVGGEPGHFDERLATVLDGLGSGYAADYKADIAKTDSLGIGVGTRVSMYTPLYFLLESEAGHGTSEVAKHWRIRSGIEQGDTALSTELNLALALRADKRVESVDFAAVWGQGHVEAERSGAAEANFIAWVKECLA